ncbi:hypothetical protein DP49_5866 [Burkholderia pseudomallei]|nr:hypothetical protein DP49_5866 [Burkholderia pseudomallei]
MCWPPRATQWLHRRFAQNLVNGRKGQCSLLVQTQFVLNPPCPLVLGPQAKNRCPIYVRDLSIRAGQRATALRAKTFFSPSW